VQLLINSYDAQRLGQDIGNKIIGGTYTGSNTVQPVIAINGSNAYVTSSTINGQGAVGLWIGVTNACVNDNTLSGTFIFGGILVSDPGTDIGMRNILNGNSSNLGMGLCSPP